MDRDDHPGRCQPRHRGRGGAELPCCGAAPSSPSSWPSSSSTRWWGRSSARLRPEPTWGRPARPKELDDEDDDRIRRAVLIGVNDDSFAPGAQRLLHAQLARRLPRHRRREASSWPQSLIVPVRRRASVAAHRRAARGAGCQRACRTKREAEAGTGRAGQIEHGDLPAFGPTSQVASTSSPSLSELDF